MKKMTTTLSLAAALTLVYATLGAPVAVAADTTQEHAVTYNAALTTDYRYRGLSQSRLKPALQGGADYTHGPSGMYLGVWASTIKWTKDLGGDGSLEIDLYGGKRGQFTEAVSYDFGGLYYAYPSNGLNPSANTFELYGQLGFGPAYVKYSHSTTNLFGTADSKGSGYVDVGANFELAPSWTLNLHVGRQTVDNNSIYSYTDFKAGVTKDLGFASLAVAIIGTDTDAYVSPVNGKNLGKGGLVVSLSKTF
ncbi:MAG: TorF family putative porin [Pseudomonadota bacterium]